MLRMTQDMADKLRQVEKAEALSGRPEAARLAIAKGLAVLFRRQSLKQKGLTSTP